MCPVVGEGERDILRRERLPIMPGRTLRELEGVVAPVASGLPARGEPRDDPLLILPGDRVIEEGQQHGTAGPGRRDLEGGRVADVSPPGKTDPWGMRREGCGRLLRGGGHG